MKMTSCPEISDYVESVLSGKTIACKYVILLCKKVKKTFKEERIHVNLDQLDKYLKIGELMYKTIYPWEKFLVALLLCTYTADNKPRWSRAMIEVARGAGKDGLIAWMSMCMISAYNPIPNYDVDICANNEDQATRPVKDVVDFLERPERIEKNKKAFKWTIENIRGIKNKGRIKGHTNSPKGKDGLRSGCVIMNEVHQYTDLANINVFTTGLGKKEQPRLFMLSTNGNVRDGVFDDYLSRGKRILDEDLDDRGFLYYLCSLDSAEEVNDETNWVKANPSLEYSESLLDETRLEYRQWLENPNELTDFMTKRMNVPQASSETAVTDYQYVKATNKELIALDRHSCVCGIDMSRTTDMCSVTLLFKEGQKRYVINHSWICTACKDWNRIKVAEKFPEWVRMGILTIVDDDEINPQLIAGYIQSQKAKYNITKLAIDDFRQSIFSYYLQKIGFTKENKNLKLVRPSDIVKVVPVIESVFLNENFFWGNNPCLRWATSNVKVIKWRTKNTDDSDFGNRLYAKIEPKSRKTDPFMSLVAAMTCENELIDTIKFDPKLLTTVVY